MSSDGGKGRTRSKVLAFVMLAVGILGLASAAWSLSSVESVDLLRYSSFEGDGALEGHMTLESGAGLENGTVRVEGTEITATTGADGRYRIEGVPSGHQTILYDGDGKNATVNTFISPSATTKMDVVLYEDPSKNFIDDTSDIEDTGIAMVTALAGIIVFFSAYSLMGSYFAYKGRRYMLVMGAAVCGIFTFGFCLGSVLSIAAIMVALWASKDFKAQPMPRLESQMEVGSEKLTSPGSSQWPEGARGPRRA
jgi:hypothetical protein